MIIIECTFTGVGCSGLAPPPLPEDIPDLTPCSYYDNVCSKFGCQYHCNAGAICRGDHFGVNFINNRCRVDQKELNCLRYCLKGKDEEARGKIECRRPPAGRECAEDNPGSCTRVNCINTYHQYCFKKCGIAGDRAPFYLRIDNTLGDKNGCYGGNHFFGGPFWTHDGD